MKKLVFSILILSVAISSFATDPLKLPSIVIDTLYESKGALVIEYEVVRPFDQISLYVQSNWEQASNRVKPVLLSGNTGKNKTSVPISLNSGQTTSINVSFNGGQFANLEDTSTYESGARSYGVFNKQTNNTVLQYRTQYSENEKSLEAKRERNFIYVDTIGQVVDATGLPVSMNLSGNKKISRNDRTIDPLAVNTYEVLEIPAQNLRSTNEPSRAPSNYTFSISGNVHAKSVLDPFGTFMPETMVFLLFRNSSNPNSFYHPVSANPSLILGTHVAKTDEGGNFSFNFSVTADLASLNLNQAIIFVARYNEYVHLNIAGDLLYYPSHDVPVFFGEPSSTIAFNPNTPGINESGKEIIVGNAVMGASLGMFWYAGRLATRLGYTPGSITVYETNVPGGYSGQFCTSLFSTQYININNSKGYNAYNLLGTPAHEYGHYFNYALWNFSYSKFSGASERTKESFAMFYSYATRHYAYKNGFGLTTIPGVPLNNALVRNKSNNADLGPFESPKFGNGFSYPAHAGWVCYLWEIFDGHPSFQGVNSDNDDIAFPTRVIQTWVGISDIGNFHNAFKNGLLTEERNSIDAIYNFTVGNSTTRMRSQFFNSSALNTISNSLIVDFTHHPYGMNAHLGNTILNPPTSFRIYQQQYANCPWSLIAEIPFVAGQSSYSRTYSIPNASQYNYKLVVNNAGGESAYPNLRINQHGNSSGVTTFANQTVRTNTTISGGGCGDMLIQNVIVTNNAKLTVISNGSTVIFDNFDLQSGAQLDLQ